MTKFAYFIVYFSVLWSEYVVEITAEGMQAYKMTSNLEDVSAATR